MNHELDLLNSVIKCRSYRTSWDREAYIVIPATPCTGLLYVTENNRSFISGHIRVRGKSDGSYPYHYLQMIDSIFGTDDNTIEVCSGYVKAGTDGAHVTVDINADRDPSQVLDAQIMAPIADESFTRWRADPPYNEKTAKEMYKGKLPNTMKLLTAGARVCKTGSLMFLLLGPQNWQMCPSGVKRIGLVFISVVPNNEIRCLNIFYKYASEPKHRLDEY